MIVEDYKILIYYGIAILIVLAIGLTFVFIQPVI